MDHRTILIDTSIFDDAIQPLDDILSKTPASHNYDISFNLTYNIINSIRVALYNDVLEFTHIGDNIYIYVVRSWDRVGPCGVLKVHICENHVKPLEVFTYILHNNRTFLIDMIWACNNIVGRSMSRMMLGKCKELFGFAIEKVNDMRRAIKINDKEYTNKIFIYNALIKVFTSDLLPFYEEGNKYIARITLCQYEVIIEIKLLSSGKHYLTNIIVCEKIDNKYTLYETIYPMCR